MLLTELELRLTDPEYKLTKIDVQIIKSYVLDPTATFRSIFARFGKRRGKNYAHFVWLLRGLTQHTSENFTVFDLLQRAVSPKGVTIREIRKTAAKHFGSVIDPRTNREVIDVTHHQMQNIMRKLHKAAADIGCRAFIRKSGAEANTQEAYDKLTTDVACDVDNHTRALIYSEYRARGQQPTPEVIDFAAADVVLKSRHAPLFIRADLSKTAKQAKVADEAYLHNLETLTGMDQEQWLNATKAEQLAAWAKLRAAHLSKLKGTT